MQLKGAERSREESNLFPFKRVPTYRGDTSVRSSYAQSSYNKETYVVDTMRQVGGGVETSVLLHVVLKDVVDTHEILSPFLGKLTPSPGEILSIVTLSRSIGGPLARHVYRLSNRKKFVTHPIFLEAAKGRGQRVLLTC